MNQGQTSSNYLKHTHSNPLQKYFINNFYKSIISLLKPLKVKKVLDVGCGEGFSLNKLYQNNIGEELEGIDNSLQSIILGKKLFPKLKLKLGNIYQLPDKSDSFDLVICTEVLEHLENPKKALREMLRVSKKYILISVPNEPFMRLSNFLRGKNIKRFGSDSGHINHWTIFSFQKLLRNEKIKIKKIIFPFPYIIVLIEK